MVDIYMLFDAVFWIAVWLCLAPTSAYHLIPFQIPCRVYFGLGHAFPIDNLVSKIGNFTLDPRGVPGP